MGVLVSGKGADGEVEDWVCDGSAVSGESEGGLIDGVLLVWLLVLFWGWGCALLRLFLCC